MNRIAVALTVSAFAVPPAPAAARLDLKPGLVATYTADDRAVTRLEPAVALALSPGESPHPRLGGVVAVRWAGQINVVQPGAYTFAANLADGTLTVRVGGKRVFADGGPGPAALRTAGAEQLAAGVQTFEAEFRAAGPAPRAELLWQGPGFRWEPIPYFFFGHLAKDQPAALATDARLEHGRFLFEELSCVRCHKPDAADAMAKTLVDRAGPDLSEIGKRAYPGWLDAWLADPQKLRPHTTMPKLFAADATGTAERYAVVQYLTSLGGPLAVARGPILSGDFRRSVERGETLFITAGCAACHGKQLSGTKKKTDDDEDDKPAAFDPVDLLYGLGSATGAQGLYALGAVGSKTRPDALAKYLEDPLRTNPHGRMPNMRLNGQDAADLARHLCQSTDDTIDRATVKAPAMTAAALAADRLPGDELAAFRKLKPDEQWRALGKSLLTAKGCVNCHTVAPGGKPLPSAVTAPTLAAVRKAGAGKGCLAPTPTAGRSPAYPLDARQRDALAAFLADGLTGAGVKAPAHATRAAIKRFHCLNCHLRDGEGGIGLELADRMRLLEKAENADDIQPPRLTGVGHKARAEWLRSVLTGGGRARPWMTLRMPQYGTDNVGFLPDAFPASEGAAPDAAAEPAAITAAKIEAGRTLAGKNGLGCISCHDIGGITGGGTRGPDLALNARRIRHDWYVRWMHNPQRIAPGTRMPQNFNDGRSVLPVVFGGDGDKQIEALWAYFALGPGLPLPAGMEPPKGLIVAVKDRPEVLRTFMPDGAGARAIAVGYPGGVSLTFDAHACRVGYAWEGNFLDASPVWNNRGGAPAKPLGPKFLTAPAGHPWAVTTSRRPPDFAKRAADYAWGAVVPDNKIYAGPVHVAFEGYSLDPTGRPAFRYRVASGEDDRAEIAVTDTPAPVKAAVAAGVARKFTVELPGGRTVWFLGGETGRQPRVYGPDGALVPVDLKDGEPEAPAVGTRVVLPQDGDRAVVLHLTAAPAGAAWRFVPRTGSGWQAVLRLPEAKSTDRAEVNLVTWSLPRDDEGLLKAISPKK